MSGDRRETPDIRLIALDLDGTLLDEDHATVPERNIRALRAAEERGAAPAIASGRVWALLTDVAAQVGAVRYAICSNGASVLDTRTGAWIYRRGLPQNQANALFVLLRARRLPFEVYCEGKNFVERGLLDLVRTCARAVTPEFLNTFERHTEVADCLDEALAGMTVEKIHVFHVPPEEREEVLARMKETGPLSVSCSFRQNLELAAEGVNKGEALRALCAALGLDRDQVMAFGDAGNDLEMLSWAGWSFAMANASEEAKAAARFRTLSNREGGVGAALERWFPGNGEKDLVNGAPVVL